MTRKSGKISLLQFGERGISALTIKPGGAGVAVLDFAVERGQWSTEDDTLASALKAFAQTHGLAQNAVYTIVPRHELTARVVELPSQDLDEIRGMVQLTAEEFVPYPGHELVTSFAVVEALEDGSSRVLVAVAHRDVVKGHLALLERAGLHTNQVLLSTSCLLAAAQARPPADVECYAVVNLAPGGLEVLVIRAGKLEYARGVAVGLDWTIEGEAREAVVRELAAEIRNSLAAHRRESPSDAAPGRVYLASETADVEVLAAAVTPELDCPCLPAAFALDSVTEGRERLTAAPLVSVGAALAALGRAETAIELLPKDELRRRAAARARKSVARIAAVAALTLAIAGGLYAQSIYQREAYAARLEQELETMRPRVHSAVVIRKHLERLRSQVEQKGSVLEVLAAIVQVMPNEGVNITNFVYRRNEGADLIGRAKQLGYVDLLSESLRQLGQTSVPQLAQATQMYTNLIRERHEDVWSFKISIPFPAQPAPGEEAAR